MATTTTTTALSNIVFRPLKMVYPATGTSPAITFAATLKRGQSIIGTPIVLGPYTTDPTSMFGFDSLNRLVSQANPSLCMSAPWTNSQTYPLTLQPCSSATAIQWTVSGVYFYPAGQTKFVLDKSSAAYARNGDQIGLFPINRGFNQQWTLGFL
ncbi:hypothetical protein HDU98_008408 [Podochytrium sp. JEL0797]|nr:hypothetical protein HDU98_008408 [Podochytrium sp. JEL0797]